MKFQRLDLGADRTLGFGQAWEAPSPYLFFDPLEFIGTTEPRVRGYICYYFAA
jgi:hypothetical protein